MAEKALDLETVPFSVAYPASYAKDEGLAVSDRLANVFYAGYQAVRTTALLLLADYLESSEVCPRVSDAIRGLRLPHWREWVDLAEMLAKFWRGDFEQKPERPTHFPALVKGWLETACPGKRRQKGDWPKLLEGCSGLDGPAKGPVDALWYARNHHAHATGTRTGDTEKDAELLNLLLPVLDGLIAALFPRKSFDLYRRLGDDSGPGLRVIQLHGPHKDRRFEAKSLGEEWASAFEKTGLVAIAGGEAVVIHPLFLPRDPDLSKGPANGGGLLEDLYLVDSVSDKTVVALGVLDQQRLSDGLTADVIAALKRKQVELGLNRMATHRWNLVDWSASTAGRLLGDLTGRKYFPDFYYERPDVDGALRRTLELDGPSRTPSTAPRGRALLLLGEAGSGKSSLLCRLVDHLLKRQAEADVDGEREKAGRRKRSRTSGSASLSRHLEGREGGDVVLYLAGAAAYGGDADKGADALLCDAIVRQGGVLAAAFGTLEHFVTKLDESAAKDGPNADRNPDRKVWIILDGLNEADRFRDLVGALDRFLPHVAERPWLRLVVSIRSGAYHELERKDRAAMRHEGAVFQNASRWASFRSERPDTFGRKQDVLYLEVRPLAAGREGAEAYRKRQDWTEGRSAGIRYEDLPPGVKTLLLSPLHLHLFHETWPGQTRVPVDLNEMGLFDAFLTRLTDEHPGLEERLEVLAEVMLERREALLPIEVAEKWEEEAGRRAASNAARLAKLSPVEELVAASILMRPVEEGEGRQRRLIGYRFSHQSLGSAVLARHLRRRLGEREVPTHRELFEWAREASGEGQEGQEPFAVLVDAVSTYVVACTEVGDGEAVGGLLELENGDVRERFLTQGLVAYGPLRGSAEEPSDEASGFWRGFRAACLRPEWITKVSDSVRLCSHQISETGFSQAAREISLLVAECCRVEVELEPANLEKKRDLAAALWLLSVLSQSAGEMEEAQRLADEDVRLMRELVRAEPRQLDWKRSLTGSLNQLRRLLKDAGETEEAQRLHEEALRLSEEVVRLSRERADTEPGRLDCKRDLVLSLIDLSGLLRDAGKIEEALRLAEEALRLTRECAEAESDELDGKQYLTLSLGQLGRVLESAGSVEASRRLAEDELGLWRALLAADPGRLDWKQSLVMTLDSLSRLLDSAGRKEEAQRRLEEAVWLGRELVEADPGRLDWKESLVMTLDSLSQLLDSAGKTEEAQQRLEEALRLIRELMEANPRRPDWKEHLALSLTRLSLLRESSRDTVEAQRLEEESLQLMRELLAIDPGRLDWTERLSISLWRLSQLLGSAGEAQSLVEESLGLMRGLLKADPNRQDWREYLTALLGQRSIFLESAGRAEEAQQLAEECLGLMREVVGAEPGRQDWREYRVAMLGCLSRLQASAGREEEVQRLLDEVVGLLRELVEAEPARLDWKSDLAERLIEQATLRAAAGRFSDAETGLEECARVLRELLDVAPERNACRRELELSLHRLAEIRLLSGRSESVQTLAEEVLSYWRESRGQRPDEPASAYELLVGLNTVARTQPIAEVRTSGNLAETEELWNELDDSFRGEPLVKLERVRMLCLRACLDPNGPDADGLGEARRILEEQSGSGAVAFKVLCMREDLRLAEEAVRAARRQ